MALKRLSKLLPPGILCMCLFACNMDQLPDTDNVYLPNYKGEIALVLGKDTLNVKDFLDELAENTTIEEGENMSLSIIYEDSSEFELGSDFINIESFNNAKYIPSPINVPFTPPVDTTVTISKQIAFNFPASGDEQIDSTYYSSGNFEMLLNSGFPADVDYFVESPSFKERANNGQLTIKSIADYQGSVPVLDQNIIGLNGYKTELVTNSDSNKFFLNIDASIFIPAGTPLSGKEYLYFDLKIADPKFDAIFGAFGKDTFNVKKQEISLDVFSDFSESGIEFEAPTITFNFKNSFGIPVGLDFSNVYASFEDKENLPLSGTITETPQNILEPNIQDFGSFAYSSIVLDGNNSNFGELITSTPDQIVLDLRGFSNLNDQTENFLLDSSRIKINSTIHLPLNIKLDEFEYESDFDVEGLDDLEGSEEISLIFSTINELPFDGEIDLFFFNEEEGEFDSLKNNVLFTSPTNFSPDGKVAEPSENISTITLDAQKIEALTSSSQLRLVTRLFSHGYQNNEFVSIFSDYSIITTLSIRGKVSVDLNGN